MFEINPEAVLIPQRFFHRPEKHFITIHAFPALDAYQVMVMTFFGVVVYDMVSRFTF
jgi:hypothetical protein